MSDLTLIEDGPDRSRLRIQLTEFQGTPLLQLRYWYKDKKSGEFKPTRKGIALTRNNYLAVKSVISDFHDNVMNHLEFGGAKKVGAADLGEVKASQRRRTESISSYGVEVRPIRPMSKLYEVAFEGSSANLILNRNHPFVARFAEEGAWSSSASVISILFIALELSKIQSEDTELTAPSVTLEMLLDRLSRVLANLTKVLE